jgi:thymidylate kinase
MINDLNASFNEEVKNHFIKNPDKLIAFEKVISEAIRKLKENNRDEYKPLKDFLNKIKSIFPTINNTEDASHTVDVNHTVVDLSLNEDVKLD